MIELILLALRLCDEVLNTLDGNGIFIIIVAHHIEIRHILAEVP